MQEGLSLFRKRSDRLMFYKIEVRFFKDFFVLGKNRSIHKIQQNNYIVWISIIFVRKVRRKNMVLIETFSERFFQASVQEILSVRSVLNWTVLSFTTLKIHSLSSLTFKNIVTVSLLVSSPKNGEIIVWPIAIPMNSK